MKFQMLNNASIPPLIKQVICLKFLKVFGVATVSTSPSSTTIKVSVVYIINLQ